MARKTKAEAEATRESILDAAEQMFFEQGVSRTSLEQIARAANVTRGAIYWHFRNKQALFEAMLGRVRNPMEARLIDLLEQQRNIDALRDICVDSLRQLATSEHHFRVFSILFLRTESDSGLAAQDEIANASIHLLQQYFSVPAVCNTLADGITPGLAALALHSHFVGIYFEWLKAPDRWNLVEQAPALVDIIFRGLLRHDVPRQTRAM